MSNSRRRVAATKSAPNSATATEDRQRTWKERAEQERTERVAACAKIIEEACTEFGCELHAYVEVGPFGVSGSRVQVVAKAGE